MKVAPKDSVYGRTVSLSYRIGIAIIKVSIGMKSFFEHLWSKMIYPTLPPITITGLNCANTTSLKQAAYKLSKQVVHHRAKAKLEKIEEENKRMLEHRLMNYEAGLAFNLEDEEFI